MCDVSKTKLFRVSIETLKHVTKVDLKIKHLNHLRTKFDSTTREDCKRATKQFSALPDISENVFLHNTLHYLRQLMPASIPSINSTVMSNQTDLGLVAP